MLRRAVPMLALAGILGLILIAAGGDVAVASKTPVVIPESAWLTDGVFKVSGLGEPSQQLIAQGVLAFSPLVEGTGEFELIISREGVIGDLVVTGTYTLPKPGKPSLVVSLPPLQSQIEIDTVLKATCKVNTKTVKEGETEVDQVKVNLNVKVQRCPLTAVPQADAKPKGCKNGTISYKGSGGHLPI